MSWRASAWAKEQRLGSPAAKSILMCLGDYADPEHAACWPSQAQLADDAEVSERTAREWLQRLEDWGLIGRERRNDRTGARANDRIVLNLEVKVLDGAQRCREIKALPDADGESLPAETAGRTGAEPTGNQAQPTGNQQPSLPATSDIPPTPPYKEEPSIEPSNGTSQTGAQARERGDFPERQDERRQSREALERRFWKMAKNHPQSAGMPKAGWRAAWLKLDAQAQDRAERCYPAWLALLKAQKKDHVPALSTYFGQNLFDDVAEPVAAGQGLVEARPFGPVWAGLCLRELMLKAPAAAPQAASEFLRRELARDDEAGMRERLARQAAYGWPSVKAWYEAAANGRSVWLKPEDVGPAAAMEPVRVLSPLWEAWRGEYQRRGWPWLPDPGRQQWVYFPAGGPGGLDAFGEAVRGSEDDAGRAQAAE